MFGMLFRFRHRPATISKSPSASNCKTIVWRLYSVAPSTISTPSMSSALPVQCTQHTLLKFGRRGRSIVSLMTNGGVSVTSHQHHFSFSCPLLPSPHSPCGIAKRLFSTSSSSGGDSVKERSVDVYGVHPGNQEPRYATACSANTVGSGSGEGVGVDLVDSISPNSSMQWDVSDAATPTSNVPPDYLLPDQLPSQDVGGTDPAAPSVADASPGRRLAQFFLSSKEAAGELHSSSSKPHTPTTAETIAFNTK